MQFNENRNKSQMLFKKARTKQRASVLNDFYLTHFSIGISFFSQEWKVDRWVSISIAQCR